MMSRQSTQEIKMPNRATAPVEHQTIEALAYQLWVERGSPLGSPETDWLRAEEQLQTTSQSVCRAA
jgi:hypothetical protein